MSENAISYFSPSKICVGEQHFIKSPKAALEIAEDAVAQVGDQDDEALKE